LAKRGFTGDTEIFDGKGGFVDVYTGFKAPAVHPSTSEAASCAQDARSAPSRLEEQVERLGNPWELVDPGLYVKRWPCCYASHRPIAGMLDMIARHKLAAEDIDRVDVGFLPGQTHPLNHTRPKNELEAKFSIEYPIAAAILDKRVGLDSFADDQVERPAAQALMEKVGRFAIPDEKSYNGLSGYNVIRIATRGGTIEEKITGTPGAPYEAMTDADRQEKFVSCALRVMAKDKAEALYARAAGLASLRDVRELWARGE